MNRSQQEEKSKFFDVIVLSLVIFVLLSATAPGLVPEPGKMTLAALGDCIISQRVSKLVEPRFLQLVNLVRSADCTWANCELPLVDISQAYPEPWGDMNIFCEPWGADELQWLGVDCVGFANNHTLDYGHVGLFSTLANLKRVGIGCAGAGKDLEEASRPRYIDTPGGRVGQVNCGNTVHKATFATQSHPYVKGKPGLNPLRTNDEFQIPKETFEMLKKLDEDIINYFGIELTEEEKEKQKKEVKIDDLKFVSGDKLYYNGKLNEEDLKRITDAIKIARRNARIVIASIHCHAGEEKHTKPVRYLETFARTCIDAGADVFFNTGPHRLWGIEIYKNKPIFYSLGNFFFQGSPIDYPAENYNRFGLAFDTRDPSLLDQKVNKIYFDKNCYWESIVPVITFTGENQVSRILLYPVVLGKNEPLHRQGTPLLADKKESKAILEDLEKLSQPYKTAIDIRGNIGVIKVNQDKVHEIKNEK
jgi:poly-gamma-glutamate capsule biosynthesis protein CapA/YwtB (metallophosphatase superfamily)